MCVCVIVVKVYSSDFIAQQWQTCLGCSLQLRCFKVLLLLVSVNIIPDQCDGAEFSVLFCMGVARLDYASHNKRVGALRYR